MTVAGVLVEDEPAARPHPAVHRAQHPIDLPHVVQRAEEADEVEGRITQLRIEVVEAGLEEVDAVDARVCGALPRDLDRFGREIEGVDALDLPRARDDELVAAGAATER